MSNVIQLPNNGPRMRCMFHNRDCIVGHNGRKHYCQQVARGSCRFPSANPFNADDRTRIILQTVFGERM